MSHFTEIKTQIRDVSALQAACDELGLPLLDRTRARGYGNQTRPGEHVIRLKGPYDIAVNKTPDGNYALTTDWWAGHVEKEVGGNFGKLLQLYGVHKTRIEARMLGDPGVLYRHPSRQACLDWEREYLEAREDARHSA